jgi:hypothetical protein
MCVSASKRKWAPLTPFTERSVCCLGGAFIFPLSLHKRGSYNHEYTNRREPSLFNYDVYPINPQALLQWATK